MINFKKMDWMNLSLIKLSAISGFLFLIKVWPWAMNLVQSIHWGWFLGAAIVFAIIPLKNLYK